jgi:hypothetical protein
MVLKAGTSVNTRWSNPPMITDCAGTHQWDLSDTERIFVLGLFALLKILIPIALSVYTWKICRTESAHERTTTLGLENFHDSETRVIERM